MIEDHKTIQLKLQLLHLQQTHQPIFSENSQLKDQIIEINKHIDTCKARLLKLVNDVSPSGEDRSLLKAVCDLDTVCCMLEEEFSNNLNSISQQKEVNMTLNKNLEEELHQMKLKQLVFESDRRNFESSIKSLKLVQKEQIENKNTIIEGLKMNIEDLLGRLCFFDDRLNNVRSHFEAKTEQLKEIFLQKQKVLQDLIDDRNSYYEEIIDQIKVEFQDKLILKDKQFSDQAQNFEQRINQLNQESIIKVNSVMLELKSQKLLVQELNGKLKTLTSQLKDKESQINGKQIQNNHLTNQVAELKSQLADIRGLRQKELKTSQEEIKLLEQKIRKLMAGSEGAYLHTSDQSVQVELTELEEKKSRMSTPQKNSKSVNQSVRFIKNYQMTSEVVHSRQKIPTVSVDKQSKPNSRKSSASSRKKSQVEFIEQSTQTIPILIIQASHSLNVDIPPHTIESVQQNQNLTTPISKGQSKRNTPKSPGQPLYNSVVLVDKQDALCQCEIISLDQMKMQIQSEIEELNQSHSQYVKELKLQNEKNKRILLESMEEMKLKLSNLQDLLDKSESFNNALRNEVEELTRELRQLKRENHRLQSIYNETVKQSFESQNSNISNLQEENNKLRFQLQLNQENSNFLKDENIQLKGKLRQIKEENSKHQEDFARHQGELVRSYEMIKYIQLELENYKKIYNMFKPTSQENLNQHSLSLDSTTPISPNHRDQMKHLKQQYATADIQNPKAHLLSFHHQRYRMRPARVAGIQVNINNTLIKGNHSPPGEKLSKILFNIEDQKQPTRKEFLPKIARYHTDYEDQRSKSSCDELILLQATDKLLHNLRTRSTSPVWVQQKAAMSIIGKKKKSPRLQIK